ncbi:MAG: hypothetical protein KME05_14625 [Gloeocapsa sp. UFS-A4-WI-NPMV-4B04]|jgi:hypothetical protein|nr:hypothetical protein [Gloeocapsa sp. UFS-A4-WI-NPMV-4B04]
MDTELVGNVNTKFKKHDRRLQKTGLNYGQKDSQQVIKSMVKGDII